MTQVAVFGDLFVRSALLIDALERHVRPVLGSLEYRACELGYPLESAQHNAEVREYVGTTDQAIEMIRGARFIVNHMSPFTREVIGHMQGVDIVGCCRTEPVNINMGAITAAGIPVVYAPGRNARAVAEFCVGLIIAETRNLARSHASLAAGEWRADLYLYDHAPAELAGQTVGLIGFGNIGKLMPGYLKPFGVRVVAYDPYVPDEAFGARGVERLIDMDALLAESDIVSLHARVTPETRGFIGEQQFRRMKRGATFINTARGPLVDYGALYRSLADGHLRGAGLETFAVEPIPPDAPLLKLPNVTLSPHIAGCSIQSAQNAAELVARDIAAFYRGEPLQHCANPEVLHG
jgi:D-3-phosphoglycerate dehydrogenase / 2-oxoglutarate reductase